MPDPQKKRMNCWEYHRCGRQPGGKNTIGLGVCPAAQDTSFEGINSGKCAGRFCWAVAGTFCEGKCQGTYAQKQSSCQECDFFKIVLAEEGTLNLRTKLLKFLPPHTKHSILDNLKLKKIKKSVRFISQGDNKDEAYITKSGSCLLIVEKKNTLHPVDHRGEGDILNMSALFTGEPVNSHFEAETDMELWVLKKKIFKKIPENDPLLYNFLTEIVADRFDSQRPISDRTIGRYVATDIIGRGGYSIVYKGVDSVTNQKVAIKMLRHNMVKDSYFLQKFKNEAKIISRLNHRNIINIFDIKEKFQTAFIIMEYLDGESIAAMLKRLKKISYQDANNYLVQACKAIGHAHNQGILHKDINPENLVIIDNYHVKLLDFGLASFIHDDDDLIDGAFLYLAPEISKGGTSNIQSDIYSLGITAFEMVVGKRPYPEKDQAIFIKMRCESEIPDPKKLEPDLPDTLRRFIIKACRLDPKQRYTDMNQAIKDLSKPINENKKPSIQKPNCWEFMKCGRGLGDPKDKCYHTCPVTQTSSLDGLNEGDKSGRTCWLVTGTFCNNKDSGTYAEKIESCRHCDFYKDVNKASGQTMLSIDNVDIFGFTHLGLLPKKNEDRYLIRQMEDKSLLLAVADGLGGNVSSDFAAEIVKGTLVGLKKLIKGKELSQIKQMAIDLDKLISNKAEAQPELEGMATTLVCAILKQDKIHWINVGDSRLYRLRNKKLKQLSEDQTLAKFLIEEGELDPKKAKEHYSYDILDQCIGYGECNPETATFSIQKNDLLILSTDGLYKMVAKDTILSILNANTSIEVKTKGLTQAALNSGGKDNITIILAKINQTLK
ncbi:MAG: protein kinase [Desulfobacula sp.]|nr:protein kinase [Desulfobacula sp.]